MTGGQARAPLVLVFDETFKGAVMACLKLSAAYRRRDLPIAATCHHRDRPRPMPRLIVGRRRGEARDPPAGADVTLPTGRGPSWPSDLEPAVGLGWHFVGGDVYSTALWERACRELRLLVSERFRGCQAVRRHAKRFLTEELFRDERSHGLQWRRSRVREPAHADRVVTVLAPATLPAVSLGTKVLKSGLRRKLGTGRRRGLSGLQLGL
ncbi:hypothetical protein [Paludisphaera mucosa]|uniref:Uncharacterized protein n=1 Tax=Paludisphaera mucosa TaxID=3030827 RepID=A0ABT6F4I5_9BACT|nr:hypothetical protein [Paludisphaera mucosa]MDG3002429.1 hypothetical protein [Paludisphaera mucosa]